MHRMRVQNPGWSVFNRKQQEENIAKTKSCMESFPPIPKFITSAPVDNVTANSVATLKTFSSVVHPPQSAESRLYKTTELLKTANSWADQNLIEDILAAVNGDFHQASAILESMFSPEIELKAGEVPSPSPPDNVDENKLSNDFHELVVASRILSVPVEPEWEEDDIYLSHRKDAIKKMRAASHHSRAASNAFLRGDHVAAHQHSMQARDEHLSAERLNNKASEEILCIRNANNDIWKIDLHGLHAGEAVDSLKKRLGQIESYLNTSLAGTSSGLAKHEAVLGQLSSLEPIKSFDFYSKAKNPLPLNRHGVLEVITGSGKHSKVQASLPVAIRSFLIENGYRFDEPRPGVIIVRPKFRRK